MLKPPALTVVPRTAPPDEMVRTPPLLTGRGADGAARRDSQDAAAEGIAGGKAASLDDQGAAACVRAAAIKARVA